MRCRAVRSRQPTAYLHAVALPGKRRPNRPSPGAAARRSACRPWRRKLKVVAPSPLPRATPRARTRPTIAQKPVPRRMRPSRCLTRQRTQRPPETAAIAARAAAARRSSRSPMSSRRCARSPRRPRCPFRERRFRRRPEARRSARGPSAAPTARCRLPIASPGCACSSFDSDLIGSSFSVRARIACVRAPWFHSEPIRRS